MPASPCELGFWIRGGVYERRDLVVHDALFRAYCALDERIDPHGEAYLSIYSFGAEFREHLERTGSTKDYAGPCGARTLWWDIDREHDLELALRDSRRLAASILDRFRSLDDADLMICYSGAKGFHIGLESFWHPEPSLLFHRAARRFAERIAGEASVAIDVGVFDRVRPFRCPNSRHRKTGLFKRRIDYETLLKVSLEGIQRLAANPEPFDPPEPKPSHDDLARARGLWLEATGRVESEREAAALRRTTTPGVGLLNRATLDFIRDGATVGDRHRLLFSAAANLAEFGTSFELAYALLADAALDSGLAPNDVRRQIECGLAHHTGPSS